MPGNLIILTSWLELEPWLELAGGIFLILLAVEKGLDISEKATYKYAQVFEFEFFVACFNLVTATSVLEANFLGRPPFVLCKDV